MTKSRTPPDSAGAQPTGTAGRPSLAEARSDQVAPGPGPDPVSVGSRVAGGGPDGVSSFTSLGTITPRPLRGTGGGPASAGVGTSVTVRGGGSLMGVGLHAHKHPAPTSRSNRRLRDAGIVAAVTGAGAIGPRASDRRGR